MTVEIGFLFLILAGMVVLFLTEKIPVDLTAFLGLVVLIFSGFVKSDEAFTGFASSAVITMLSIFIVSASLLHTGIADLVGVRIHAWVGSREVPLIITIMLVSGILSAFMNNIAAAAVLLACSGESGPPRRPFSFTPPHAPFFRCHPGRHDNPGGNSPQHPGWSHVGSSGDGVL